MSTLSAPFPFFLCLSLFLFYIHPAQTFNKIDVYRRDQLLRDKLRHYLDRYASHERESLARDNNRAESLYSGGSVYHRRACEAMYRCRRAALEQNPEVQGNGEYFVQIGVGSKAEKHYTVLDTASDVTWIQCKSCADCYHQTDPVFDPAMSESYKPLECNSRQCQLLPGPNCPSTRETCPYEVKYDDGSATAGDFATETLLIGDTAFKNIAIGCGHKNKGLFAKASGVFGLGRRSLSFISQANYSAFSYCLTDRNSSKPSILELGSPTKFEDAVVTTPLLLNNKYPTFYFVDVTGITVNEEVVSIPPLDRSSGHGGAIVDCGAIVTRFPKEVYNRVRDLFVKAATGLKSVHPTDPFDTCFALTSNSEADFPTVALRFGANLLTLPEKNVMFPVGNSICFGFAPTTKGPFSIIGNNLQQGIRVSFDEKTPLVGFLPDNC